MFLIECPFCGPRDQTEFKAGGEAHRVRPEGPLGDDAWAQFLFMRENVKGPHRERWVHAAGCGRWFNVVRSTATDRIYGSYPIGAEPPPLPAEPRATPAGEARGSGNDAAKLA